MYVRKLRFWILWHFDIESTWVIRYVAFWKKLSAKSYEQ